MRGNIVAACSTNSVLNKELTSSSATGDALYMNQPTAWIMLLPKRGKNVNQTEMGPVGRLRRRHQGEVPVAVHAWVERNGLAACR